MISRKCFLFLEQQLGYGEQQLGALGEGGCGDIS